MPTIPFDDGLIQPPLLRTRPPFPWVLAAICAFSAPHAHAKGPERPVFIPLEQLGQMPVGGGRPQMPGSTIATVDFVGDHHLLVTFPVRRLMKRLPDSLPDDEDRMIDAVLVDIPSGKVAARTTWRVHDSGQYLWNLGRGHFLLRVRDRLLAFAPLANLSTEHPFEEHRLLAYDRRILGVLVAAESDLLTVETEERPPAREANAPAAAGANPARPAVPVPAKPSNRRVEINFYRMDEGQNGVEVVSSGHIEAIAAIEIPMTREGYLDISEESRGRWLFDYIGHAGKKLELSPFDTSCFPRAKFVSRAEFVAIGCRGSIDKLAIGGFNLRGEQMWQQNFFESFVHPTFSFAPQGGRFALGRAITTMQASTLAGAEPEADQLSGQDVMVLQMPSGRQVFHTVLTPVQRFGQNFALAPDGQELAVIRAGMVELYRLPATSEKERRDLKTVREVALDKFDGPIELPTRLRKTVTASVAAPGPEKNTETSASVPTTAPEPSAKAATPASGVAAAQPQPTKIEDPVNVGDVPPTDGRRKAPTLYGPEAVPSAPPH